MNASAPEEQLRPDDAEGGLAEVGVYATKREAAAHGLVVLAMGLPYWLEATEAGWRLQVLDERRLEISAQLRAYDRESLSWPPREEANLPAMGFACWLTPLVWVWALLAIYAEQQTRSEQWTEAGVLNARAVWEKGEIWRLGTALFLHADGGHVLANAGAGLVVFAAVLTTLGVWRGWALLGAAALTTNLLLTLLHWKSEYRSLGASTAVFAGLGLLTGKAAVRAWRSTRSANWAAVFPPLAAGLCLLGLLGGGEGPVDIGAHAVGFLVGCVAGAGEGVLKGEERREKDGSRMRKDE